MKKVEAIIKPFELDDVREAAAGAGAHGMTISEVHGFERLRGRGEIHGGTEDVADFVPRLKVEMLVEEDQVARLAGAIRRVACKGRIGDGEIFVVDIDDAVRIRTGEHGATAV